MPRYPPCAAKDKGVLLFSTAERSAEAPYSSNNMTTDSCPCDAAKDSRLSVPSLVLVVFSNRQLGWDQALAREISAPMHHGRRLQLKPSASTPHDSTRLERPSSNAFRAVVS